MKTTRAAFDGIGPRSSLEEGPSSRRVDEIDADPCSSLTKNELLSRRIGMLDSLIERYSSEFWLLGEELLQKKDLKQEGSDQRVSESASVVDLQKEFAGTGDGVNLPHAALLQQYVNNLPDGTVSARSRGAQQRREAKENFVNVHLKEISRLEMSSHAALAKEMEAHGALAMLCGTLKTYYIRSHIVTVGRKSRCMNSQNTNIDIDITEEAALYGPVQAVPRCQARIFLDSDGMFRIQNCSDGRPLNVDGKIIGKGKTRTLVNMSFIGVAGVGLLFMQKPLTSSHSRPQPHILAHDNNT